MEQIVTVVQSTLLFVAVSEGFGTAIDLLSDSEVDTVQIVRPSLPSFSGQCIPDISVQHRLYMYPASQSLIPTNPS